MKHIHKFIRTISANTFTWRCTDCKWFVHQGLSHIMIGKDAICWECENIFQLTESSMEEAKPRCDACRANLIAVPSADKLNEFLEKQKAKKLAEEAQKSEDKIEIDEG